MSVGVPEEGSLAINSSFLILMMNFLSLGMGVLFELERIQGISAWVILSFRKFVLNLFDVRRLMKSLTKLVWSRRVRRAFP